TALHLHIAVIHGVHIVDGGWCTGARLAVRHPRHGGRTFACFSLLRRRLHSVMTLCWSLLCTMVHAGHAHRTVIHARHIHRTMIHAGHVHRTVIHAWSRHRRIGSL